MGSKVLAVAAVAALASGVGLGFGAGAGTPNRITQALHIPKATSAARSPRLQPRPWPASLRVDGALAVPGEDGDTAILSLRVGDTTTTYPVTLPAFTVQVPGTRPDAMVSIEIQTADAKYASILGSYRRMARKAGSDAVLNPAELDRVRVTAMGTSLHYYVARELGGHMPASDGDHEQAIRSIGDEVAVGGHLLQSLATGTVVLPEAYAHGYALLQDQPGFRAYLADQPQLTIEGWQAFAREPSGIGFPTAVLDGKTALLPALPFGEPAMTDGFATLLMREGDHHELHGSSNVDSFATVVALDPETVRVTPRQAVRTYFYTLLQPAPGKPFVDVLTRHDAVNETYTRQFVGDRYSLWSASTAVEVSYPQNPELLPYAYSYTRMLHAVGIDKLSQRLAWQDVIGRRVLPYFCVAPGALGFTEIWGCQYAQTTFMPNRSGIAEDLGARIDGDFLPRVNGFLSETFEWSLGARGSLNLRSADTDVSYWAIEGGNAVAVPVLYLARKRTSEGVVYSRAGISVLMDARVPTGFEQIPAEGSWKYGTFEQGREQGTWSQAPVVTTFLRTTDGISRQITMRTEPPASSYTRRSSWQLVDVPIGSQSHLRLYDIRYRANDGTTYPSCEEAIADGVTSCIPDQVRYFRPMAQLGSRMYGIEELYQNGATFGQDSVLYRSARPNYYERVADWKGPVLRNPQSPKRQSAGRRP